MMRTFLALVLSLCASAFAAAPVINVQTSRTSGDAPLYVQFDLSGTTVNGSSCFNTCDFRGYAGHAKSGTHANGASGKSRAQLEHGVMGYVYPEPGTYTAVFLACNTDGCTRATSTITVTDPLVTHAGKVACLYLTVAGTCPDKSTPIQISNLSSLATRINTNGDRLILFKGGETFPCTGTTNLANGSTARIRSYGTGKAIWSRASGNCQVATSGANDIAISDIDFRGEGGMTSDPLFSISPAGSVGSAQITLYNITGSGAQGLVICGASGLTTAYDQIGIFSNTFTGKVGTQGYNIFCSGRRISVVDNNLTNSITEWTVARFSQVERYVFAHNTVSEPGGTYSNLQIRGPDYSAGSGGFAANSYSEKIVVTDNRFTGITGAMVQIAPQDTIYDEYIRLVKIAGNLWERTGGSTSTFALSVEATDVSIDRNVFSSTNGQNTSFVNIVSNSAVGVPVPNNIRIYHNTFYSGGVNGTAISVTGSATNVTTGFNCYWKSSTAGTQTLLSGVSAGTGDCTPSEGGASPFAGGSSPVNMIDFRLAPGSSWANVAACAGYLTDALAYMWPASGNCDTGAMSSHTIRRGVAGQ